MNIGIVPFGAVGRLVIVYRHVRNTHERVHAGFVGHHSVVEAKINRNADEKIGQPEEMGVSGEARRNGESPVKSTGRLIYGSPALDL